MIIIDYKDRRPIYEQIIDRVRMLIVTGVYEPDMPLPSVRSLAIELGINPNTIQRAYQELERTGFIYSVKGRGSFVNGSKALIEEQHMKMISQLGTELNKLRDAGIEKEQILKVVENCYEEKEKDT